MWESHFDKLYSLQQIAFHEHMLPSIDIMKLEPVIYTDNLTLTNYYSSPVTLIEFPQFQSSKL
jgi:hypothetical protein